MKRILSFAVLILAFAAVSHAVPVNHAFHGVTAREYAPAQDHCYLAYYNICSGWAFAWSGWCFGMWEDPHNPPRFGTCFDLSDCPEDCRSLHDVWMAVYPYLTGWAQADVEIYCGDGAGCPVGEPLASIHCYIDAASYWQHFNFGGLELCACDLVFGRFIVMVTNSSAPPQPPNACWAPLSDHVPHNVQEGCADWRCDDTHSFVYNNLVDYCVIYGAPSPLWLDRDFAPCTLAPMGPPVGCFYGPGFYTEWIIDCYIECQGPTATEEESWSEIKALYR